MARLQISLSLGLALSLCAFGQTTDQHQPGPGREIARGTGDIGVGVAKGTGNLAKGAGKGALDLVTLHPIDAGVAVGKGAVGAGKNVTAGAVRGTGKIGKGVGRAFKKLF
jgi:hypothetical protein